MIRVYEYGGEMLRCNGRGQWEVWEEGPDGWEWRLCVFSKHTEQALFSLQPYWLQPGDMLHREGRVRPVLDVRKGYVVLAGTGYLAMDEALKLRMCDKDMEI